MELENLFLKIFDYLSRSLNKYVRKIIENGGLPEVTVNEYLYLEIINNLDKPNFSDLSMSLKLTKPSITVMINKLIGKGYVCKYQSDVDRRTFFIRLTQEGKKIIEAEKAVYKDFISKIKEYLSKEELNQLSNILAKIVRKHFYNRGDSEIK